MTMALGSGIKPAKADLWAQALAPLLLPGEEVRLLVKGAFANMGGDLVAITNLRLLGAATQQHCRVRSEIALADVASVAPASRMGRPAVGLAMKDGSQRKITLMSLRSADADEKLTGNVLYGLLQEEPTPELRDAQAAQDARRQAAAAALTQAKDGLWPNTTVIGSRPREKAAETVLAHCREGESPWLIISSLGQGLLAAFDDRLIIVKTGAWTGLASGAMGGGRIASFSFDQITGIEYNSGLMMGVLEVLTPSYSGGANKDFWRGADRSLNKDNNNPNTLSNTLPVDKAMHAQALPHLNELRDRISKARTITVRVEQERPTAGGGLADQLARLVELRDAGVLDAEEFATAKRRLLDI